MYCGSPNFDVSCSVASGWSNGFSVSQSYQLSLGEFALRTGWSRTQTTSFSVGASVTIPKGECWGMYSTHQRPTKTGASYKTTPISGSGYPYRYYEKFMGYSTVFSGQATNGHAEFKASQSSCSNW